MSGCHNGLSGGDAGEYTLNTYAGIRSIVIARQSGFQQTRGRDYEWFDAPTRAYADQFIAIGRNRNLDQPGCIKQYLYRRFLRYGQCYLFCYHQHDFTE